MGKSNIPWCDYVWNPIAGCTKVSAGCKNCWAERMAFRQKRMGQADYQEVVDKEGHWTGQVRRLRHRLEQPLHWRKPRRIFVCSMSDLFHPLVPFDFIAQVFDIMACPRAEQHTFILLTKRADRMRHFYAWLRARFDAGGFWSGDTALGLALEEYWPLPNVWVMVTIENNNTRWRGYELLRIPAVVRGICLEPMLEFVNVAPFLRPYQVNLATEISSMRKHLGSKVHWLIIGGESGPARRAFDPKWAWKLLGPAKRAGTAVWLKQGSGLHSNVPLLDEQGREVKEWPK